LIAGKRPSGILAHIPVTPYLRLNFQIADDPPGGDGQRYAARQEPFLLNRLARPGTHFYDKAVKRAPRAFS
jgi:hypothetical protein